MANVGSSQYRPSIFAKCIWLIGCIVALTMAMPITMAHAVTLTSFAPSNGPVGTSVTLIGTGFNTTAASNNVTINGAPVGITSATATQLVITVPADAATGLIQVSVAGDTATSANAFLVTITGSVVPVDGASLSASNTTAGSDLSFTFNGAIGQSLGLGISSLVLSPVGSVSIFVNAPDGRLIGGSMCPTLCTVDLANLPATGIYTVRVRPFGAATVSLIATLSSDISGTASLSAPMDVALTRPGQIARIAFIATAGQTLGLELSNLSMAPRQQLQYLVSRPDGEDLPLLRNGWLYASVAPFLLPLVQLPLSGTYTLVLQPVDTISTMAVHLAIGAPVNLPIDAAPITQDLRLAGQMGLLSFSASAGQNLGLGVTVSNYAAVAGTSVFAPDGTRLADRIYCGNIHADAGDTGCRIDLDHLALSGTYIIVINDAPARVFGSGVSGTPVFTATLSNPLTETLSFGGPILNVDINRSGQSAYIAFNGSVGQNLQLSWTTLTLTSSATFWLYIYQPNGELFTSLNIDPIHLGVLYLPTLPVTGTYKMVVAFNNADTGRMPLTLTTQSCPSDPAIVPPPTRTTITAVTPNPVAFGGTYIVHVDVMACGISTPAGTVVVTASDSICTYDTASGSTCTLVATSTGTLPIMAEFRPADLTALKLSNGGSDITVNTGRVSVAIASVAPEPSVVGQTYTVHATVAPIAPATVAATGTITIHAGTDQCTITLPGDSCDLTSSTVGTAALTATYNGDAHYDAATSTPVSHRTANGASVAILDATPEPSAAGDPYTVRVAVVPLDSAGIAPTGSVTVSDGTSSCVVTLPSLGCSLTGTASGWILLSARYSGDATYAGAVSFISGHTILAAPPTGAKEMCGIDAVTIDSFESPSFVPIDQLPGVVLSPGLNRSIIGSGSLSFTVESPSAGATTAESSVDVLGTFSGPANTGITINGVVGQTSHGQFLVANVPLAPGSNSLAITATVLSGTTATGTLSVTRAGTAAPVALQVTSAYGLAPATLTFEPVIGTLPENATVQSMALDADGDGTYDFSATAPAVLPTIITYPQPGRYNAALRVTDSNGIDYVAHRAVMVGDLAAHRGMLCDVYGYLKDRLNAHEATNASNAYHGIVRDQYQSLFTTLGSRMPDAASNLGFITKGFIGPGFAELTLVRDNTDQTRSGYPLRLTQGSDGVWRISEM